MRFPPLFSVLCAVLATFPAYAGGSGERLIIVSVRDQKLAVVEDGNAVAEFPVSTSKFGIGDRHGSYETPLGEMQVAQKIGSNAPVGAVFKGRRMTGEILRPNATGRDPIVTRILWLRGLESCNAHAYERGIYIHGTGEERKIGRPASYGCIRMRSRDVVRVFNSVGVGAHVKIVNQSLGRALSAQAQTPSHAMKVSKVAAVSHGDLATSEAPQLYASLPVY